MPIRFHRRQDAGPDHIGLTRRKFLMTTTMAGVTAAGLLGTARFALATPLAEDQGRLLFRMVQDIYPHPDLLQAAHYQVIADSVVRGLEGNSDKAAALAEGLAQINTIAQSLHGTDYASIEDADAREGVLRHVQHEAFFQDVRWTAYFGIYDNKEIWPLFGYQGASAEHGGYIDRGFSDIAFVPQGPTLEERMAAVQQ